MEGIFVIGNGTAPLDVIDNGIAVTDLATIGDLATGAIAIFGYYNTGILPITLATPGTDGIPNSISVFQALGDGVFKQVHGIIPNNFEIQEQARVVGVPQVICIGADGGTGAMSFGAAIAIGDVFGIEITNLRMQPYEKYRTKSVSYTVLTAAVDDDAICTALVAALNADPGISSILTASVINGDDGILLTANNSECLFKARVLDNLIGSTITDDGSDNSTAPVPAIGTYAEVAEAERIGAVAEGSLYALDTQGVIAPIFKSPKFAVDGLAYDALTINMKHVTNHGWGVPPSLPSESTITLYYNNADAADFADTIAYLKAMANVSASNYLVANAGA